MSDDSGSPASEPVAWMDAHDHTNLYYRKPTQVDVVPLFAHPPAALPEGWLAEARRLACELASNSYALGKAHAVPDFDDANGLIEAENEAMKALLAHLKLAEGQVEHGDALRDAFPDLSAAAKSLGGIGSKGVGDV